MADKEFKIEVTLPGGEKRVKAVKAADKLAAIDKAKSELSALGLEDSAFKAK